MKFIALDFEYFNSQQPQLTLVAGAVANEKGSLALWLHNSPDNCNELKEFLLKHRETHTLICFNADAEARSLVALGLNPIKFNWVDLQVEWKMITNHWDKYRYGRHLIQGRKVKTKRNTSYKKEAGVNNSKPPVNLIGMTYNLLGHEEDSKYKTKMRDLILSKGPYSKKDQDEILTYCKGDIKDLFKLKDKVLEIYSKAPRKFRKRDHLKDMLSRGKDATRSSWISTTGYPVDVKEIITFTRNVPNILKDTQEDINSQFPDAPPFYWNKPRKGYSMKQAVLKDWIKSQKMDKDWLQTDKGDLSLSLEAWEKHFPYKHSFPRDNFPAQILRFLKLKKSLNGFMPKSATAKNQDTFFSSLGKDGRVRPWLNPFGAQSARFQPKATGFIPLKAAWMRALIKPRKGRAICSIDYGSQEFLLAGLISEDQNMIEAYRSGDVYLYFAKKAGAVPEDGTKAQYPKERNRFKSTTLGISYSMGAKGLAKKLTLDMGEPHTDKQAQKLIDLYYKTYPGYKKYQELLLRHYDTHKHITLPCGWTMFGDNDNHRSVGNMPIQGFGSTILRKAIELSQDAGLDVIYPLHDALYIEYDSNDLSAIDTLREKMHEAFCYYFDGEMHEAAKIIRLDIDAWSPDYENGETLTPKGFTVETKDIYIDPRSKNEYEFFKKYLGH